MDRAEAVKILEIQLDVTEVNAPSCIELHEALDLAIEALRQTESEDCISRKQAIEEVENICNTPCNEYFVKAIESLPPVTPKERTGEWIPCSERLPEYTVDMWDEGVIATVNGREGNIIYENGIVPDAWFEDGKWYVNDVELENAKVVAWQPLPEPYKDGDTE